MNKDLLALVEKNNFEKVGDKMVATVSLEHIEELVKILQEKFNASVSLSAFQYDLVKDDKPIVKIRKNLILTLRTKESGSDSEELELEAMALEIELHLLKFAA